MTDQQEAAGPGPRHASRRALPEPTRPRRLLPNILRPRSIRAKVVALLMVPVISLMALWAFATVTTAQSVSELQRVKEVNATLLSPVGRFVMAVQAERSAASRYLAGSSIGQYILTSAGSDTDAAVEELRTGINQSRTEAAAIDSRLPERIDSLLRAANDMTDIRESAAAREIDPREAFAVYTAVVTEAFAVNGLVTREHVDEVASDPRVVLELSLAREMIAREDAVMSSAHAAGAMTAEQHGMFVGAVEAGRALLTSGIGDLHLDDDATFRTILDGESYQALRAFEDSVVRGEAGADIMVEVPEAEWNEAASAVQDALAAAEAEASTVATEESSLFGLGILGSAGLAVGLGLVGVVLSLLISVKVGRGLLVELMGLRNSAMDLAGRKLPAALRRLHSGETVDLDDEAPVTTTNEDEVTQVEQALGAVHRAAIRAAIERSEALSGISGVYVHLARRSQVLLHRQLALLETMERRTEDPDELEDLFRLDHLTTRMRRQAESLIILSGASPARRWRTPVPAVDVMRAAVAEVEEFTRVEVVELPDVRIAGPAVADVTHLIAELVENAVAFSPPHTKARVRGELVGSGLAIEIEDRGLGMSSQAMADANRRAKDPDQVDLLETDQLGLFVVNRLAQRQNVEATLQRSPYGGVTAIVLIPNEIIETSERDDEPRTLIRAQLTTAPLPSVPPGSRAASWQEAASDSARWLPGMPEGTWPPPLPPPTPETVPSVPLRDMKRITPTDAAAEEPVAEELDGEVDDLPRRVRQASLVPELREGEAPSPSRSSEDDVRTPEQARDTLSALRTGWLRGQADRPPKGDEG